MKGASSAQVLRHGVFAVAVGVVGAAASVVLCLVVGWAYDLVCAHDWLLYLLPIFAVASLLLYRALKLPLDTTTHTVINDICADRPISPALAPGILLGTALSILGGASVGKEAAALHMGASLGDLVARPLKLRPLTGVWKGGSRADGASGTDGGDGAVESACASKGAVGSVDASKGTDDGLGAAGGAGIGAAASGGVHAYAASCGMAACFAALFFAPLGSTAFVVELSRYDRSVWRHAPFMLLACFVAFGLASIIGIGDVIPKVPLPALSWPVVGQCVVIAVACALVGTVYIQIIDGAQRLTKRISQNYYLWAALGGVLMAVLVMLFDWRGFEGTGANLLSDALAGRAGGWTFAVKALLTIVCLGLWLRGGEIMPTFTVGALLGASCTVMTQGDPAFSAAVGLVAFFAAMSRCPVTAFLMGCEIFGWAAAPAFALAVAVSFSLGRDVGLYGRGATGILKRATSAARARLVVKKP